MTVSFICGVLKKSTSEAYSLDCSESGDASNHVFDLAAATTFVPAVAKFAPVASKTLPALTDPLGPSANDLIQAGYPPRPDPNLAPKSYKKWLAAVSESATLVPPNLVVRSDVHFGNSTAWCGPGLLQPSTRYIVGVNLFNVPNFSPVGSSLSAAVWVGLDYNDIIQDGVYFQSRGTLGAIEAWFEYFCPGNPLPQACQPVFNTNMVIGEGDQMYFYAWEGDSQCNSGAGHTGFGCFWEKNNTRGGVTPVIPVQAPNGLFSGASAEGILERQSGIALSKWSSAQQEFDAWDSNGVEHDVSTDFGQDVTLVNGSGGPMCTDTDISPDNVAYNFVSSN